MTPEIIRDLTATKAMKVFHLMNEFHRNANWCGYFYNGLETDALSEAATYDKSPRHGYHITIWHRNNFSLNPSDFINMITQTQPFDAQVLGYADDGKNQAIAVTRPPVFLSSVVPHVTISWVAKGNPAASGYMQFSPSIPESIPKCLTNGTMKVIMHNNRDMDLEIFRHSIKNLELERMDELANQLSPNARAVIDGHYDIMPWEELASRLISNGIEFNEKIAKLYAQYRVDTTDSKMPTLSAQINELLKIDAQYDKASDIEQEKESTLLEI